MLESCESVLWKGLDAEAVSVEVRKGSFECAYRGIPSNSQVGYRSAASWTSVKMQSMRCEHSLSGQRMSRWHRVGLGQSRICPRMYRVRPLECGLLSRVSKSGRGCVVQAAERQRGLAEAGPAPVAAHEAWLPSPDIRTSTGWVFHKRDERSNVG